MITPNSELTEESMKTALVEARGDLFIAATSLSISPLRMTKYIQASSALAVVMDECQAAGRDTPMQKLHANVEAAIQQRVSIYRVVGLDSLAELATMPINVNSAQNQVKLAAAARLAGSQEHSAGSGELGETLRALNDAYHSHAPRIKVTRERLSIEVNGTPAEHQLP